MDVLKWSGEMSVLKGHVSDCNSPPRGWFNGRVSYFEMERNKSLTSFLEISLKYRNRTKINVSWYDYIDFELINIKIIRICVQILIYINLVIYTFCTNILIYKSISNGK